MKMDRRSNGGPQEDECGKLERESRVILLLIIVICFCPINMLVLLTLFSSASGLKNLLQ